MANLVIDTGNSFTKMAVFEKNELLWADHYKDVSAATVAGLSGKYNISTAIVSSVKKETINWQALLGDNVLLKYFSSAMTAGINNQYTTPHTLGLDRLAAVMGARELYPDVANLVIDAGTCITYDWTDKDGNYFGGSISPGLMMRYKALHHYTDALPLAEPDSKFEAAYGDSTLNAMLSGVQNGLKYEITGFIESYFINGQRLNVILTGGDGIFFDTLLKNSIFAPYIKNEPWLVLKGLNAATQKHND